MKGDARDRAARPRARRRAGVACFALLAAVACLAAAASPAAGAKAEVERLTYQVPVRAPDELGQPVSLDTDVYLPSDRPPKRGRPLVAIFHGGGSEKSNRFDSGHAKTLARDGYAALLYSARGHGDSGGQTTVIGPKEVSDGFDVLAWALGSEGRDEPDHPGFHLDRERIALWGDSQGGLHTNLLQAWSWDRELNPYGIRFRALLPANTPSYTFEALIQNGVVKASFGLGLLQTYLVGAKARISPLIAKWSASAAADQPSEGFLCDYSEHDTPTSTMMQDLAARSVACFLEQMRPPMLWTQALDDHLFPGEMAVEMWKSIPNEENRLYLDMGGHAAPGAPKEIERAELRARIRFLDHELRGRPLGGPRVIYWERDPSVEVPADSYRYPEGAWQRQSANRWPPLGVRNASYQLSADGRAVPEGAQEGSLPLAAAASDEGNDPVAHAAFSATPLGTTVPSSLPATEAPGLIASFETEPFAAERRLAGRARASLPWTPYSPDTQLVVELLDRAPDGALTLLGRGVRGVREAEPGRQRRVTVPLNEFAARIGVGHSLVAWVMASDPLFYKPYAGMVGGSLAAGPGAVLRVPLQRAGG